MFILFEAQFKIIVEPKALLGSYWVHPTKTTPPTPNFQSSLNKSIQVLHHHMIHFWNPKDKTFLIQHI